MNKNMRFFIHSIRIIFVISIGILTFNSSRVCMFPRRFRQNSTSLVMSCKNLDDKYVFVTCFYPMKQAIDDYKTKISRLFNYYNKDMPLFIFTNKEGKEILKNSRFVDGQSTSLTPNIKFITKYKNIFDIPKISELKAQYEKLATKLQNESSINTTDETWAINIAKYIFLNDTITIYSNESKLFFWINIDIIETDEITKQIKPLTWPSSLRVEKLFSFNLDDEMNDNGFIEKVIFWGTARSFKKSGSVDEVNLDDYDDLIDSRFFGGPPEKVTKFIEEFFSIQKVALNKNLNALVRDDLIIGAFMSLNKNDVLLFDKSKSKCNRRESVIAFLANSNVCGYSNTAYVYMTKRGSYFPVEKSIDDWLAFE